MDNSGSLPLGIMKQAIMKMDSFITDIRECIEDEDISQENKQTFEKVAEMAGNMQAVIVNMAMSEIDEADFLNEMIDPDEIDAFPGTVDDIMDETI